MFCKLFCEIGKCILVDQDCKLILRQDQHVRHLLSGQFRTFSFCTSFQPQRRQHFRKTHTERNRCRIQEPKFEECCICFETICHMHQRFTAKIITLERIAVYIMPLNSADRARPSDIVGNAKLFPFRITGLISLS